MPTLQRYPNAVALDLLIPSTWLPCLLQVADEIHFKIQTWAVCVQKGFPPISLYQHVIRIIDQWKMKNNAYFIIDWVIQLEGKWEKLGVVRSQHGGETAITIAWRLRDDDTR